jgi:SAM-dependent methyltransferase
MPVTTVATAPATAAPELKDQAAVVLGHAAGYAGHRTIAIGLRSGLLEALAGAPEGATAGELAGRLGLDELYVAVWCRSAFSAGVCDRDPDGTRYRLAPHMATLLLDKGSPAYAGGVFLVLEQHEMFGRFEASLPSGARLWWDDTSPEWINTVAGTGTPFYTRLVPGGLQQVPGLAERLEAGMTVVDTACGAGVGLVRLAQHYPACRFIGVDGDQHSIDRARQLVADAGLSDRVELICSPLEDFELSEQVGLVVNNISMHECRDADQVTRRVLDALEPGGWFVISDFPFPDTDQGLRSVPGRIMGAIQFFEAQIDDQLLPRSTYDQLLTRHGFTGLGSATITPMHAITWGRRPSS